MTRRDFGYLAWVAFLASASLPPLTVVAVFMALYWSGWCADDWFAARRAVALDRAYDDLADATFLLALHNLQRTETTHAR